MKKITISILALSSVFILSSCGNTSTTEKTTETGTNAVVTPLPSKYDANKVEISDFKFTPSVITIKNDKP